MTDCHNPECKILKPHQHGDRGVFFPWEKERKRLNLRVAVLEHEVRKLKSRLLIRVGTGEMAGRSSEVAG